jgi:pimeloyl-ACP methyl ester carboxylesterase
VNLTAARGACLLLLRRAGAVALLVLSMTLTWIAPLARPQSAFPALPDLRFAPIGHREAFPGDRWSYMEAGRAGASPVVLLHGVGDNSMDWRFQLAGLSDRFHVVAWNAPGYMLSDGFKAETPGCREYADALADFLDSLGTTQVNLVGFSFGSRVAQCFAIHHPGRAIALAMIGTGIGPKGLSEADRARIVAEREAQIASGSYGFGARVDALLSRNAPPELREIVRNGLRAINRRGFMQGVGLGLVDGYSPGEVAAVVKVPVLMISGSDDIVNPIATNAALFKKAMPAARLEVLPGVGHLAQMEAPDQVNRLLREFLTK